MTTISELQQRAKDIQERIWALEDECDGMGEDECKELMQLRALLAALKAVGV
jgi:uncharacterized protein Yka (UPF0111/DUF47 family)